MESEKPNEVERNRQYWLEQGKKAEQITYGMLSDGFRSLEGIPDEFCSAEDPKDRAELWREYQQRQVRSSDECWRCGRAGCGCD